MEKCTLNDPEIKQCCCNCEYHWKVNKHCSTQTTKENRDKENCCCNELKGYACVVREGVVYDNWPKHSVGCEMYTSKTQS